MKKFDNVFNSIIKSMRCKSELSVEGKLGKYIDDNPDYSLILETASVFRYDVFSRFIDFIDSIPENEIPKIIAQKEMKILGLNVNKFKRKDIDVKDKDLCIVKIDFSDQSDYNRIKFIDLMAKIDSAADSNHNVFVSSMNSVFRKLSIAGGAYMPFQQDMGILFCNPKLDKKEKEILYHELIHFIQDVTGNGKPDIEKLIEQNFLNDLNDDEDKKFTPVQLLTKTRADVHGFPSYLVDNLMNEEDVVAYINNIALTFKNNGVDAKKALEVVNSIIRRANEMDGKASKKKNIIQLYNEILKIPELDGIYEAEAGLLSLIAVLKQHRTLLKKTIGNYLQRL